jgi:long-chain acyl-CoA synthetase
MRISRFEERFNFRIMHGYGLSETTCYSCFLPPDLTDDEHKGWMRGHGFPSIGLAIEPNEMAIHDDNGNALGEGERGEIVIRGHNVMMYYYNRPDANADTFCHGWFRSGDEGFIKKDGQGREFFFITGRLKELIIRGGINISPFEIDEALQAIPGVRAGIAVAFENDAYGEEIGAYVVPDEGAALTADEVIAAAAKELPFNKRPKVVKFGTEIPATSTGKYQRNKLKGLFDDYRTVQFRKK